ncbi:hypothetical protein J6590_100914 [Homalodisca vitripennis]|nr:hypothetical protein J6590_100914 [Homalodisca vitripennis]
MIHSIRRLRKVSVKEPTAICSIQLAPKQKNNASVEMQSLLCPLPLQIWQEHLGYLISTIIVKKHLHYAIDTATFITIGCHIVNNISNFELI